MAVMHGLAKYFIQIKTSDSDLSLSEVVDVFLLVSWQTQCPYAEM